MRVDVSELCRVNGDALRRLILEKYGRLTAFYERAPVDLGVSTQTLKRFIGMGKPSRKELARKMLALLGEDAADYSTYFADEGKRKHRPANNREVIEALILKVEELQQKIDNLANTINLYHRWNKKI
jgi:hypothetical protein